MENFWWKIIHSYFFRLFLSSSSNTKWFIIATHLNHFFSSLHFSSLHFSSLLIFSLLFSSLLFSSLLFHFFILLLCTCFPLFYLTLFLNNYIIPFVNVIVIVSFFRPFGFYLYCSIFLSFYFVPFSYHFVLSFLL